VATRAPVRTLDRLVDHASDAQGVRFDAIQAGDWLVVRTRNSTYSMAASRRGEFIVAGGWFTSHGRESVPVQVLGCTWGGHALHTGVVAAIGMCVEFSNGVRTTRVCELRHIRGGAAAGAH
jgi:hypothetical protein